MNLIMNSVQAMPEGGELSLSGSASDSFLEIKIADTGIGIPDNINSKVFDPFLRQKRQAPVSVFQSFTI